MAPCMSDQMVTRQTDVRRLPSKSNSRCNISIDSHSILYPTPIAFIQRRDWCIVALTNVAVAPCMPGQMVTTQAHAVRVPSKSNSRCEIKHFHLHQTGPLPSNNTVVTLFVLKYCYLVWLTVVIHHVVMMENVGSQTLAGSQTVRFARAFFRVPDSFSFAVTKRYRWKLSGVRYWDISTDEIRKYKMPSWVQCSMWWL